MNKRNGNGRVKVSIKPVSLSSTDEGFVDVMLDCDLVGETVCRISMDMGGGCNANILYSRNDNALNILGHSEMIKLRNKIVDVSWIFVRNCYYLPHEWMVVAQETGFDIWMAKELMAPEFLKEMKGLEPRFPLFKGKPIS